MDKKVKAILIGLLAIVTATGAAFGIAAQNRGSNDSNQTAEKQTHRSQAQVQENPNESEVGDEANETSEENGADEQGEKAEANETSEKSEMNEADETNESAETNAEEQTENAASAKLQPSAKITPEQAKSAALAQVSGTARTVELEKANGSVVYDVEIQIADGGIREVRVDAGSGKVLPAESDAENDGSD